MVSSQSLEAKQVSSVSRAVTSLAIDAPIQGPILMAYASPALTGVFLKAIQWIPSTADQSQSYYQFLEDFYQRDNSTQEKSVRENIKILGSVSAPVSNRQAHQNSSLLIGCHVHALFLLVDAIFFAVEYSRRCSFSK